MLSVPLENGTIDLGNPGLGIDLTDDGVTGNDSDDSDLGANGLQNFPLIGRALAGAGVLVVEGTLSSSPNHVLPEAVFVGRAT